MENNPKLEPMKLGDWIHNSGLVIEGFQQSEKKPSRLQNAERNGTILLKPIPVSQLNLSFQVVKPSVSQTPARSATSTKKKTSNSSVKVVNKQRMTDTKPHCRQTLNFSSKVKATDTRKTVIDKATPHLRNLMSKCNKGKGAHDSSKEIKISGFKRIPVTPPNQESVVKKLQIVTPNTVQMTLIQDSPLLSPSPKLSDGEASFLRIEKELVDNIVKGNELDISISLPTSTPFKTNKLEHLLTTDINSHDNIKSIFMNQSENENTIVSLCDVFKNALRSNSYKKIDPQEEQASLKSVIEEVQNYLQEIEDSDKENTVKNHGNHSVSKSISVIKSPTFVTKKKVVYQKKIVKSTQLSPKVENGAPLNMYMGLKNNFNFLYTPKLKTTRSNNIDSPVRITNSLKSQISKLYEDES